MRCGGLTPCISFEERRVHDRGAIQILGSRRNLARDAQVGMVLLMRRPRGAPRGPSRGGYLEGDLDVKRDVRVAASPYRGPRICAGVCTPGALDGGRQAPGETPGGVQGGEGGFGSRPIPEPNGGGGGSRVEYFLKLSRLV